MDRSHPSSYPTGFIFAKSVTDARAIAEANFGSVTAVDGSFDTVAVVTSVVSSDVLTDDGLYAVSSVLIGLVLPCDGVYTVSQAIGILRKHLVIRTKTPVYVAVTDADQMTDVPVYVLYLVEDVVKAVETTL